MTNNRAMQLVWSRMRQRCQNPKADGYHNYGGRGITVCERWQKFENFLLDMGERPSSKHTVERKNNDLGYSPDNCRWATRKEQADNRRTNHLLTYNGETLNVGQWAERLGLKYPTLSARINKFRWDLERALQSLT